VQTLFRYACGCWIAILGALCLGTIASTGANAASDYDVVVYGESSAGVIAAVEAARMGKTTLLISKSQHVGGMTASGLGATDTGNAATIGGLALTFYANIYRYYHGGNATVAMEAASANTVSADASWRDGVQFNFEPHVAESVFRAMLQRAGAACVFGEQLDRVAGVLRQGARITALRMKSGRSFSARVFIDATYEGDLMAAAGVRYRIGRESRDEFHESVAGVYRDNDLLGEVDPYRIAGDPTSGLLPGISAIDPGPDGTGDGRVQQYNLRLCVTNVPDNRIPFTRPETYDRANYELLARRLARRPDMPITDVVKIQAMPNAKADINGNGSFSTDMAGDDSTRWSEATDAERAAIVETYRDYTAGLFWFLSNDPAVPAQIQAEAQQWGLAADEFTDTDHWPWQLYVREARRMVGSYVMTQRDCDGRALPPEPVALASYAIDSHKVTLFVDEAGRLNTEGYMFHGVDPFPISYRALVPTAGECTNLIVPICLSATHAAFNSIRMEPVYMMLGHAAGAAAALAATEAVTVQGVGYGELARQLRAEGQILTWPNGGDVIPSLFEDQPEEPAPTPILRDMRRRDTSPRRLTLQEQ
jgi:hypothetical protein